MTSTAPEPDSRASESAAAVDAVVRAGGGRRSLRGGELVLLRRRERDAGAAAVAAAGGSGLELAGGVAVRARPLRAARPVQLEFVPVSEGPSPELVWASLPERAREAVLLLLVRLISSGALEEREEP